MQIKATLNADKGAVKEEPLYNAGGNVRYKGKNPTKQQTPKQLRIRMKKQVTLRGGH
jgi:hypothetical protein